MACGKAAQVLTIQMRMMKTFPCIGVILDFRGYSITWKKKDPRPIQQFKLGLFIRHLATGILFQSCKNLVGG